MKKLASLFLLTTASFAFSQSAPDLTTLKKHLPAGTEVTSVEESPIKGLYQVQIGGQILYVSADGKIGITGDLIDLETRESLSDKSLAKWRKAQIANVPDSEKIVFKAENEKYVVDVFTDITCGYCVKLHEQIEDYNKNGITIRYLAFPRAGLTSDVANKMQNIWCSSDPKKALSNAKLSRQLPEANPDCNSNTVSEQYALGSDLGINGTPSLYFSDGTHQPGYLAPKQLLSRLNEVFKK